MKIRSIIRTVLLLLSVSLVLPLLVSAGQGEYTILAGSYRQLENAEADFQQLRDSITQSFLSGLRIEKVGEFYTLRIGNFPERSGADDFLPVVRQRFSEARVLEAKIKPERIVKEIDLESPLGQESDINISPEHTLKPIEEMLKGINRQQEGDGSEQLGDSLQIVVISPQGRVKKQITNKLSLNLYSIDDSTEYYTIQVGSFAKKGLAVLEYDRLVGSLPDWLVNWLRIEKIQGYYTVRVGLFVSKEEADDARVYLKKRFAKSRLLYAFIKSKRIIRVSEATPLPGGRLVKERSFVDADKPLEVNEALSDDPTNSKIIEEALPEDDFGRDEVFADDIDAEKSHVHVEPVFVETSDKKAVDVVEPIKESSLNSNNTKVIYSKKRKQQINDGSQPGFSSIKPPADAKEFFTLQVSSFSDIALANIEFDNIVQKYRDGVLDNLRIEFVKGFFTVRIGKFDNRSDVNNLSQMLQDVYPRATVLYAYILPERLQRQYPTEEIVSNKIEENVIYKEVDMANEPVADIMDIPADEKGEDIIVPDPPELNLQQGEISTVDISTKTSEPEIETDEISAVLDAGNDHFDDLEKVEPEEKVSVAPTVTVGDNNTQETIEVPEFSYEVVTVLDKDDQGNSIKMPSALFYDYGSDELYMINGVNNRIIVYGPDFFPQNSLGKGRGLDSPLGGFISPSGMVYITQAGTPKSKSRLTILNKAFFPEKDIEINFPDSADFIPQKVAVSQNGEVFLTGLNSRKVLSLNADFSFKEWIEVSIDKRGEYSYSDGAAPAKTALIKDVKVDKEGNVFLLSEETSKIYIFNNKGNFLFSFGVKGGAEGKMSRPRSLVVDEKRHCFFVVDYMRHTVLIYDFTGKFRYEFGGRGWGAEWFNYPVDITLGRNGQVIVADFFNQRTQVFRVKWRDVFPERPADLWGNDL